METIKPYLADLRPDDEPQILELHKRLVNAGCAVELKPAKSGQVVSYRHPQTGQTVLNLLARKSGPHLRLYAEHHADYADKIEAFPDKLAAKVAKASDCRRLLDPTKCNARCPTGYVLALRGETLRKCRYAAFLLPVTDETLPHLLPLVEGELAARGL